MSPLKLKPEKKGILFCFLARSVLARPTVRNLQQQGTPHSQCRCVQNLNNHSKLAARILCMCIRLWD
jgi:hypothetical protein